MAYSCEWWGRNGIKHQNWTRLKQDLEDRTFKLLGVEFKDGKTVWRFENLETGLTAYNPFRIIYHNEDPLFERILAAQMKEKLKREKNKAKASVRTKRV